MVQGQGRVPRISSPIKEEEAKGDNIYKSQGTQQRQLLSLLQIKPMMAETLQISQDYYDLESMVQADARPFILKKSKLSEELVVHQSRSWGWRLQIPFGYGHLMQTWDLVQPDKPSSPEFIVTLDGVPSNPNPNRPPPPQDTCQIKRMACAFKEWDPHTTLQLHMRHLQVSSTHSSYTCWAGLRTQMVAFQTLRWVNWAWQRNQKSCWSTASTGLPAKTGTSMLTITGSPCKAFPDCKFAEKCLFVHPNCKYDAKCTKPDCPFTHMSRRTPGLPPKPGQWLHFCIWVTRGKFCDCELNSKEIVWDHCVRIS